MTELKDWVKMTTFLQRNPEWTYYQLRVLANNRKSNGFDQCIRKIGKSFYYSEPKVAKWVEDHEVA